MQIAIAVFAVIVAIGLGLFACYLLGLVGLLLWGFFNFLADRPERQRRPYRRQRTRWEWVRKGRPEWLLCATALLLCEVPVVLANLAHQGAAPMPLGLLPVLFGLVFLAVAYLPKRA